MKNYPVTRVIGQPQWQQLPRVALEHRYLQTSPEICAYGQLAYNEEFLFVHLQAQVPYIRAEEQGICGEPCKDSCLEFFFCPVAGDPHYFNIEFNFNGCMYLGYGTGLKDLLRLLPDAGSVICPEISKTEDGWEIAYAIPWELIRRLMPKAAPVGTLKANFYACSDLSEPPYYLSWSEVPEEQFTFHRSQCFGNISFCD